MSNDSGYGFGAGRRSLLQAAVAGLALLLAKASPATAKTEEPVPAQLRIGFQKSAVNLVILKSQAVLEKKYPNTKVSWVDFPAGPQLLEALAAGSLDFGLTGDSPPVFAQAAGKDLVYVGVEPPKPLSTGILVKPNSPLRTLADLKGRRIGLQKGSSSQYVLLRAVDQAGLQWSDINPVYLTPADARAAFERGAIDAWVIWDPFYAATELDVAPRVLATGEGLSGNNSFYLASRPFAQNHPQTVLAMLAELSRANDYWQANRKETAQYLSDYSGLSLATVHLLLSRRPSSPVTPVGAKVVADQQRVADAFARIGLIPKPVRVAEIVWQPSGARLAKT
ncbi:sulfonate ABC transporter substrate-binding protein [Roseateles toxinivorans]|uniref:Putative aliphatic sulfonates-binding protein n=1 Tax=Roseateles toxinivorans TaxID=270368 RepID=A0A4V3CTK5_9BURK|nr:sulfonate ABC transporter substrate-binding protein [Roseateles toxinivorans]TDP72614.1 sulfonate transport system substrate-binding protein [Roseateles toxinivorans]